MMGLVERARANACGAVEAAPEAGAPRAVPDPARRVLWRVLVTWHARLVGLRQRHPEHRRADAVGAVVL